MKYLVLALMLVKLCASTGQTIKQWGEVKQRTIFRHPGGQVTFKDRDGNPVTVSGTVIIEKMDKAQIN